MVKKLLITLVTIITLLIIAGLWGNAYDNGFSISRSIKLHQPADIVWQHLLDVKESAAWHPEILSAERINQDDSTAQRWKITFQDNRILVLENLALEKDKIFNSRIIQNSVPVSGNWVYELKSFGKHSEKTLLTLTENITTENPYLKLWFTLYGHDTAVKNYLKYFSTALGEPNVMIEGR